MQNVYVQTVVEQSLKALATSMAKAVLKVDKRKKNFTFMISWCSRHGCCSHTLQAVSVSRGCGSQYRLHSTAQLRYRAWAMAYMDMDGAHDHVVFAWERLKLRSLAVQTNWTC